MNALFQALNGANRPPQNQMGQTPGVMPQAGNGGIFGRMQQLANVFQNPQAMVQQVFPDAPAEATGNPDQLLAWMQQTGKVTPQMIQMARGMMGGR